MLDNDLFLRVGVFGKKRFDHLTVTHKDDGAIEFSHSEGSPFNDCLGSVVAPHGINCDLHVCLPEDFSDLFDLHDLATAVKSTVGTNSVRDLGLAAF